MSNSTDKKSIISFIIPCYASEGSVGLVIDEIREVVAQKPDYDYQIVAVNDCSPDNVLSVLQEIAAKDPKVGVIDLAKNGGRHNALICGCHYAAGDYVVFIDDDQQCPADRLWDLLDPLINGDYDVSIARYRKKTQSGFKNFGSAVNDRVATWLLGKDPKLKFSNFSVMKKFVKDEVIKYTNPYPYLSGLMLRATKRVINVDMEERVRTILLGQASAHSDSHRRDLGCPRRPHGPEDRDPQTPEPGNPAGIQFHHGRTALFHRHDHVYAGTDRRICRTNLYIPE